MGIESDKVVYEYLSRVGDVAQQRQLPSMTRMRLVSELRDEIDRHRARTAVDSPAAVRRILDRLGSPDDVVTAAGGDTRELPRTPVTAVPEQRDQRDAAPAPEPRPKGLRRAVPRPRPTAPEPPARADGPAPPHLAPAHELGDSAVRPDWWRTEPHPFGSATGDSVPGFTGGVEIPDLLKRPEDLRPVEPKERKEDPEAAAPPAATPVPRRGLLRRRTAPAPGTPGTPGSPAPRRRLLPGPATGWTNPLLLLGAAALVAGAVLGIWPALIAGWLIAYVSRRLTPAETKWAVFGMPGLSLAATVLWLWGRQTHHWGTPIPDARMNEALTGTWPWTLRLAAITSALFILWRSQRSR
ncbi:hypothetical protein KUM39_09910 [Streptomyces sp. J2-1]|uniref:hypothetical protein n=1 Tax=Streptomyces corallincola TaxID=2851888 RepID=UPI001C38E30F|nr:hypothetical protein [Streptomyces corallincola]MBV2354675.1 hypothetical protein [Streptomyces corallincola]